MSSKGSNRKCLATQRKCQAPARLPIAHCLVASGHRRAVHAGFRTV